MGVEGEVGGNQILLKDGKTKILIDFGYNFKNGEATSTSP